MKAITELTETDLLELWSVVGGAPHLYEYGKVELREGLVNGTWYDCGLLMDYYTMAAVVDVLRAKGYDGGIVAGGVADKLPGLYMHIEDEAGGSLSVGPVTSFHDVKMDLIGEITSFLEEHNSGHYVVVIGDEKAVILLLEINRLGSMERIMSLVYSMMGKNF